MNSCWNSKYCECSYFFNQILHLKNNLWIKIIFCFSLCLLIYPTEFSSLNKSFVKPYFQALLLYKIFFKTFYCSGWKINFQVLKKVVYLRFGEKLTGLDPRWRLGNQAAQKYTIFLTGQVSILSVSHGTKEALAVSHNYRKRTIYSYI